MGFPMLFWTKSVILLTAIVGKWRGAPEPLQNAAYFFIWRVSL